MIEKTIAGLKVGDDQPVRIMGVINLSKESFYKNSVVSPEHVLDAALKMIDEGADIIDVGARSTWPLAAKISKNEERSRLIPAFVPLRIFLCRFRWIRCFQTLQRKRLLPVRR